MLQDDLTIEVSTEDRATRISLSGEIDFDNVGRLRNQLVELIQSELPIS